MELTLVNILKAIVRNPDDIKVERVDMDNGKVMFQISSNEDDKGLIIGKSGRTIKALNDIIAIKALKDNKRVILKIQ